jgi:lipopolysaccharide/colanic/teichoic acid biosynthesis glycosyltransferase
MYRHFGKRFLDILLSSLALLITLPLIAVAALGLRLAIGSPVLFWQERPGRGGKPFRIVKFRTMLDTTDAAGQPLPDADRLTPFGRWLRRTSIDELPELWNVLRGEMSLVGPRPLLMKYIDRYTARQARRHEVRPGITGLAQVSGRNALDWDRRLELDVQYVERLSPLLDLRILALTVWRVLARQGISQPGRDTVDEFIGSQGR